MAFASCPQWPDLHDDGPLLSTALHDAGIDAHTAVWSDPDVPWTSFDLVVANGTWDNIHHPRAFLAWVAALEGGGVRLVNFPATLRWNLDKRYLRDLEASGVPTVPTLWVEAAESVGAVALPKGEVVVKPSVSGGGYRTARYEPHQHAAALDHVAALVGSGRTAMVQPYQASVDSAGEIGLVFLGGAFSHAIHKEPMIRRGAGATDSLITNQVVTAAVAPAGHLAVARRALAAAERLLGPTTYARVDVVHGADGGPVLLELELLDPVLFFVQSPDRTATFARVLGDLLTEPRKL